MAFRHFYQTYIPGQITDEGIEQSENIITRDFVNETLPYVTNEKDVEFIMNNLILGGSAVTKLVTKTLRHKEYKDLTLPFIGSEYDVTAGSFIRSYLDSYEDASFEQRLKTVIVLGTFVELAPLMNLSAFNTVDNIDGTEKTSPFRVNQYIGMIRRTMVSIIGNMIDEVYANYGSVRFGRVSLI